MAVGDPVSNLDDLVSLSTGGSGGAPEQINFFKKASIGGSAAVATVAGRMTSLWRYDGSPAGATTTPTTAVVCTNATAGSFKQTTPAASARKRLLSLVGISTNLGSIVLYDRLVMHGGMSGTSLTAPQVTNLTSSTTPALTRHTSGIGVELWLEIYSAIGGTARTVTASYTNTTPTSGKTTQATTWGSAGFQEQDRIIPLPLAAGDIGVTSCQGVTNSATTGTAGDFGITLAYPLLTLRLPVVGSGFMWSGILTAGGPIDLGVNSDASLALAWYPNGITTPEIFGQAFFIEK